MADQDKPEAKGSRQPRPADQLVQIAMEMYELRRTADSHSTSGEIVSEGHLYAVLRDDHSRRFELAQVRETIAEVYEVRYDSVPSRTHLGDAMTVLRGKARKVRPDEADPAAELLAAHGVTTDLDEHPGRLKVHAGGRNPYDAAREVADYLLKINDPPRLFAMGPASAVLLRDEGKLDALDQDGWLAYVAERIDFLSRTNDGERIVAPPVTVLKIVTAIILRELPQLDGVTTTPYLDADGNLVACDGYHPGSHLFLRTEGLTLPEVADKPTSAQVAKAAKLLIEDWLGDFPFASPADKANLVAELLTLTGRELFPLAPMFVHDASTSGSGKGLLLSTIAIIATGQPPEVMELPGDGEEQRKTITSVLLSGKLLVAWDELHVIAGRTLAAILTAEVYSGRILSTNKLASVRNKLIQIALGNNVEVRGDMKRRVVPSRLVPDTDHPERRSDFRHPDLPRWVREHRGELLAAAFVLWRNWLAKGRPPADVTMGSFERWARTIGGVLQTAGISGFGTNTTEWLSYSEDDDGWPNHLEQLRLLYGPRWFTAAEVADAVAVGRLKRPPVKRDPDKELVLQIAYAYRGQRERLYGDLRLIRSKERDSATGGRTWAVRRRRERDEDANAHDGSAREVPGSSSGSSVSPETAGQHPDKGTEHEVIPPGHPQEPTDHRQLPGGHHQDPPKSKTAGHRSDSEDTDDPDDQKRHSATGDARALDVPPMRWRSDDSPAIGDDPDGGRAA